MLSFTEKHTQKFLGGIIFLVCYAILFGYSLGPQSALDTFWHLQMGKDFLENGLSPWVDHYSFTFYGEKISSVPIMFQVTLAYLVSSFGEITGFILLKLIYVTLLFLALAQYFRQIKAPWFILFLILPILTYFIQMRLLIRPELLSNILLIICLSLYLRARENFVSKELFSIGILMFFWVNYHTPILGYIIIFGLFLDRAIHKFFDKNMPYTWKQWFLWGSIIFFIGFLNPKFEHALLAILSLPEEWHLYLSEYAPSYIAYSSNKMVLLLWAISLCTVYWAIQKKHYGLGFIALILGYYSVSILRLVPVTGLINLCIFSLFLSQVNYSRLLENTRPSLRIASYCSALYLFIFTLSQTSDHTLERLKAFQNLPQHINAMSQKMDERYPAQISDYLNSFQDRGNVLNTFNIGGYLLHNLSTHFKVYIDGRTNILYPIEFYKHYLDVIKDINVLEQEVKKYNVKYAVFENTPKAHLYFNKTDMLTINFASEKYVMFSDNKDLSFPIASKLTLFPMCWNNNLSKYVQGEISSAKLLLDDKDYTIKFILKLLDDYLSHENKFQFVDSLRPEDYKYDSVKRLVSHLALGSGNYSAAVQFANTVKIKNESDLLMMSYALAMTKNYETAKAYLGFHLNKKGDLNKNSISDFDKIIILKILTNTLKDSKSQGNTSINIEQVKDELKINDELIAESLLPKLPYNAICHQILN